jgi:lysophospholipid acyltransferase (LPLAT)-like uncharacterized protein
MLCQLFFGRDAFSMKIRNRFLIVCLGILAAWCIRLWNWTFRYRHVSFGPDLNPRLPGLAGRYIYGFWHEDMIVPAYQYACPDLHVLISRHADGQLIAEAIRRLGLKVVSGSTSRGAAEAVLKLMQVARDNHIAITPDGPRGPRRCTQLGIVFIAAKTGLPIVPFGFGYARAWRTGSWDRMALPRPFTRVVGVTLPPIHVPDVEDKDQLEGYRQQVERAMREASRLAHELAAGSEVVVANPLQQQTTKPDQAA